MEARAGNSILYFKTLFSGFRKLINGSGLSKLLAFSGKFLDSMVLACIFGLVLTNPTIETPYIRFSVAFLCVGSSSRIDCNLFKLPTVVILLV